MDGWLDNNQMNRWINYLCRIRCLLLDVTAPHSTFDFPGLEVKTISNPNLISVNSSLSFDINHITSQVNADISKTLRYTIKQCIDMISRGVATFKNRIPSDDDPVSTLLHKSDTSLIVDFFWRPVCLYYYNKISL